MSKGLIGAILASIFIPGTGFAAAVGKGFISILIFLFGTAHGAGKVSSIMDKITYKNIYKILRASLNYTVEHSWHNINSFEDCWEDDWYDINRVSYALSKFVKLSSCVDDNILEEAKKLLGYYSEFSDTLTKYEYWKSGYDDIVSEKPEFPTELKEKIIEQSKIVINILDEQKVSD